MASLLLLGLLTLLPCAHAGHPRARTSTQALPDLLEAFPALAQQRPWLCKDDSQAPPIAGWQVVPAECAWQNRLRVRHWNAITVVPVRNCISPMAAWWNWARPQGAAPFAWRSDWASQSLRDDGGAEKRIIVLRRQADGQWRASEWRWLPSERLATRRWQEARWNLLAARAGQLSHPAKPAPGARETRMLWQVMEENLGRRAGEIDGGALKWLADGRCLLADTTSPGPQQLQLSYASEDSRLEQRAAMQLQLARRYPKATWLSNFSLVPSRPHVREGAKFYAIWTESGQLAAQLWIPVRGDGPLQRLRIATPVAADPASAASAKALVERELFAIAALWSRHDE